MATGGGIEIEILDKQVRKKMDDLLAASGNVTPAMQVVGRKVKTKVQLGFRTGTDPWGNPWKPLSPMTRKGQPLRNTGHLMASITAQTTGDSVEIGTNLQSNGVKFPAVHQFGMTIKPVSAKYLSWVNALGIRFNVKKVTIPARPFLPLDANGNTELPDQWSVDALVALRNHFDKAIQA
jgi:phage gpG-like protein